MMSPRGNHAVPSTATSVGSRPSPSRPTDRCWRRRAPTARSASGRGIGCSARRHRRKRKNPMPAFDQLLSDPPAAAVVQAMLTAVERANYRCRVGKLEPSRADYEKFFAGEFVKESEGVWLWLGGETSTSTYTQHLRQTLLGLAWWTSPQGQRHVKVVGRRIEPGNEMRENRF